MHGAIIRMFEKNWSVNDELAQYLCFVFVVLQATNAVQALQVYPSAPPHADTIHYEMRPQMHLQERTPCIITSLTRSHTALYVY